MPASELPELVLSLEYPLGLKNRGTRRYAVRFCLKLGLTQDKNGECAFKDVLDALIAANFNANLQEGLPQADGADVVKEVTKRRTSSLSRGDQAHDWNAPLTPRRKGLARQFAQKLLSMAVGRYRARANARQARASASPAGKGMKKARPETPPTAPPKRAAGGYAKLVDEDQEAKDRAAARIGAAAKGKSARVVTKEKKEERAKQAKAKVEAEMKAKEESAVKVQALARGKKARKEARASPYVQAPPQQQPPTAAELEGVDALPDPAALATDDAAAAAAAAAAEQAAVEAAVAADLAAAAQNGGALPTIGSAKKAPPKCNGAGRPTAKPLGAKPGGAKPPGARPAGARPAGAKPAGAKPPGARPGPNGKPAGAKPRPRP